VKRTLKRESKVLEIVRREAIGAGGSFSHPFGCFGVSKIPRGGRRWLGSARQVLLAFGSLFSLGREKRKQE